MKIDDEDLIKMIGEITPDDIESGSVLVFSVRLDGMPRHYYEKISKQLTEYVKSTFHGKIKALVVPDTIEVSLLPGLLNK